VPTHFHRIARDYMEAPGVMRRDLAERRDGPRVTLDGDDLPRPLRQQRAGEPARTRTDLDHGHAFEWAASAGNARRQVEVEEEVLAKRSFCRQSMPSDRLA
jgi:hypothetical protein